LLSQSLKYDIEALLLTKEEQLDKYKLFENFILQANIVSAPYFSRNQLSNNRFRSNSARGARF